MSKSRYLIALILATLFCVAMAFFYKISISDSILFIFVLWMLPLSIRLGNNILQRELGIFKDALKSKKDNCDTLSSKLEGIKREKIYLEEKFTNLSKLYMITKEMSFDVRFDELFNSLKNFMEDNFQFGKFRVVLFRYENDKRVVEKTYEISSESKGYTELTSTLRDLAGFIAKSKKPMFLEQERDLVNFGFNSSIRNILAIPLIVRQKVISVILTEGVKKDDYDNFLILAPQIALQIERISLFENVEGLSIIDGLTGVFLRRYFLERFREELSRAVQCSLNLSVIMVDLDHFKDCNDSFGHLTGDVVLKEVAGILKKNVREIDLVARFGGEEFCILLPEADKAGAYVVGERIREAIKDYTIKAYDESVRITVSMGISSFPEDSNQVEKLIENADRALYEAKKHGRNRVEISNKNKK